MHFREPAAQIEIRGVKMDKTAQALDRGRRVTSGEVDGDSLKNVGLGHGVHYGDGCLTGPVVVPDICLVPRPDFLPSLYG